MYESKYSQYVTKSNSRFADAEEIKRVCYPIEKGKKTEACGIPMYMEDGKLYVDSSDSHFAVYGGTGSKKSRVVECNFINSCLEADQNLIINDPGGEAYRRTAYRARKNEYKVYVLNLRDTEKSHGWNPLQLAYELYYKGYEAEAEQAINDFVNAVMGPATETATDKFWPDNAGMALTYDVELLLDSVPLKYFNLQNVIQMSHEANAPYLRELLLEMDQSSSAAVLMHSILDLSAEKTSSCIYSTLKQGLKPFVQNKSLLKLLCENQINFGDLVNEKTVIYIIYPDEKTALGFLINLFLTQCYQYLVTYASKLPNVSLERRVNFVLDEFSNLPKVEGFDNRISAARKYNIRYAVFTQSYGQLENKYGSVAETIIANCDWIVFPSKEYDFLRKVSLMCGTEYDFYGVEHDLVSVSDILHFEKQPDGAEALIIKSGQYPFVTKLPDYEYIDVFKIYPEADLIDIERVDGAMFLTFNDWFKGVGTEFKKPFPAGPPKPVYKEKRTPRTREEMLNNEELQKELEKKFDELFGPVSDDEED